MVYKDNARVLERLLETMVSNLSIDLPKLPTTVKSIGQIAKLSPAVFENFSREVVRDFIVTQVCNHGNYTP